jgi:hypothetical protein
VAQVSKLNLLFHLGLVVFVQNVKHHLRKICYLHCIKIDLLGSEFLNLIFNLTVFRVTQWEGISFLTVILLSMAGGIGKENCNFSFRLPVLFEGVFESSCNIFREITTT